MHTRPSTVFAIEDPFVAYCFDRAVGTFGMALENRIQEISRNTKKSKDAEKKIQVEVTKWLRDDEPIVKPDAPGRFRDPMATM